MTDLSSELRMAVGRVYRRFRSERAEGQLGDAAVSVLSHLSKYGQKSLTELSAHSRVTAGSMSQTVNRLTELGYAVRSPDPLDGRRVLFNATAEGSALIEATYAGSVAWFDGQLALLSEDERATLTAAAALMLRMADA